MSFRKNRKVATTTAALLAALAAGWPTAARATDTFTGGAGGTHTDWFTASNWAISAPSTIAPPTASDQANMNSGTTAIINGAATAGSMFVGVGTGTSVVSITSTGSLALSGASLLGNNVGSTGEIDNAGAFTMNSLLTLGNNGDGNFNQTAGSTTFSGTAGAIKLGVIGTTTRTGTLTLSGGTFTTSTTFTGLERVGDSATGVINQTGGTFTLNGSGESGALLLGNGGSGEYDLGGTGLLQLNNGNIDINAGSAPHALFSMSGGAITQTAAATGNIFVNSASNGGSTTTGSFSLTGGTITMTGGNVIVGEQTGKATWTQSAGSLLLTGTSASQLQLQIGNLGGARQQFTLSGTGVITTSGSSIIVGNNGQNNADLAMSGGTMTVGGSGSLFLTGAGDNTHAGVTTAEISGGTLTTPTIDQTNGGGSVFTLSGTAVVNAGSWLKTTFGPGDARTDSVVLNGGTLNVGSTNFAVVNTGTKFSPGLAATLRTTAVGGGYSQDASSAYEVTLGTPGTGHTSPGTSDLINANGSLSLAGTIDVVTPTTAAGGSYKIFTYNGTSTLTSPTINNAPGTHASLFDGGTGTGTGKGIYLDVFNDASPAYHLDPSVTPPSGTTLSNGDTVASKYTLSFGNPDAEFTSGSAKLDLFNLLLAVNSSFQDSMLTGIFDLSQLGPFTQTGFTSSGALTATASPTGGQELTPTISFSGLADGTYAGKIFFTPTSRSGSDLTLAPVELDITLTIPEPASSTLLVGGGMLLLGRRRREV